MNNCCVNFQDNRGVYKPPKIAPTTMEEGRKSKQERDAERKSKDTLRRVRQSEYVKSLVDDLEGRPEEVQFFNNLVMWLFYVNWVLLALKFCSVMQHR